MSGEGHAERVTLPAAPTPERARQANSRDTDPEGSHTETRRVPRRLLSLIQSPAPIKVEQQRCRIERTST